MKLNESAIKTACVILFAAAMLFGSPTRSALTLDPRELADLELQVHQQINRIRSQKNIPALAINEHLRAEARRHAENMIRRNFFSHEDPERGGLSERLDSVGINWMRCAENIYRENGITNPSQDAVKAWMDSDSHRTNILDGRFKDSGVGAAMQSNGTLIIVQEFLR